MGQAELLFRQAVQVDPSNEVAWLWLSSVLEDVAEKRFCLDRALAINPQSIGAQRGLKILPQETTPKSPFAKLSPHGDDEPNARIRDPATLLPATSSTMTSPADTAMPRTPAASPQSQVALPSAEPPKTLHLVPP